MERIMELFHNEPIRLDTFELWELFEDFIGHDNLVRQLKRKTNIKSIIFDEDDSTWIVETNFTTLGPGIHSR